jgi:hypothetical protein
MNALQTCTVLNAEYIASPVCMQIWRLWHQLPFPNGNSGSAAGHPQAQHRHRTSGCRNCSCPVCSARYLQHLNKAHAGCCPLVLPDTACGCVSQERYHPWRLFRRAGDIGGMHHSAYHTSQLMPLQLFFNGCHQSGCRDVKSCSKRSCSHTHRSFSFECCPAPSFAPTITTASGCSRFGCGHLPYGDVPFNRIDVQIHRRSVHAACSSDFHTTA